MKLSATLCVSFVALAGFVYVTNGALAEPPDPCKTGCKTSHGHATSYLNPQPLPPGVKGAGPHPYAIGRSPLPVPARVHGCPGGMKREHVCVRWFNPHGGGPNPLP